MRLIDKETLIDALDAICSRNGSDVVSRDEVFDAINEQEPARCETCRYMSWWSNDSVYPYCSKPNSPVICYTNKDFACSYYTKR